MRSRRCNALGKRARQRASRNSGSPRRSFTIPKEGVAELQEALGLAEPPRILEGIDIAHLQGGEMVGSKVCFIDGVPFKDGYRRYKIKHGQGNNDYLSIQEVVSPALSRGRREQRAVSRRDPHRRRPRPASRGAGSLQDDGRQAADGDLAGEEGGAGLRAGQERADPACAITWG